MERSTLNLVIIVSMALASPYSLVLPEPFIAECLSIGDKHLKAGAYNL